MNQSSSNFAKNIENKIVGLEKRLLEPQISEPQSHKNLEGLNKSRTIKPLNYEDPSNVKKEPEESLPKREERIDFIENSHWTGSRRGYFINYQKIK